MNISETNRLKIKFHLEHRWGGVKAALGFGPDQIRTLVSMAPDSSHRVLMRKCCDHSSAFMFDWIFFISAGYENNHNLSNVRNLARSDQGQRSQLPLPIDL